MIPSDLKRIVAPYSAYVVGGSVRDFLMGRVPCDFDIAVANDPKTVAKRLATHFERRVIELGRENQAVYRVVTPSYSFDLTALNGICIEDDLKLRDFTINAMAWEPVSGKIIDPFGGRQDLIPKRLKMVSPTIFSKDPVRLLRAFRIAAQLGFAIESKTLAAIAHNAPLILKIAGERIHSEFFGLLENDQAHPYLCQMADNKLLSALLPELDVLKGCSQNKHHHYDVLAHTLAAFGHLETLIKEKATRFGPTARAALIFLDTKRAGLIKCALLLHDIGKPQVKTGPSSYSHFYGHEKKGVAMLVPIAKRLRLSTRENDFIGFMIRNHLRPLMLFLAHQQQKLTRTGFTRFFSKSDGFTPDLLLHAMADHMGKGPPEDNQDHAFSRFMEQLLADFEGRFMPLRSSKPLLNGHDLISVFKLDPSAEFKKLLALVEQAKRSGQISTRTEALTLVADKLKT
jgi:poly(A) polymerase